MPDELFQYLVAQWRNVPSCESRNRFCPEAIRQLARGSYIFHLTYHYRRVEFDDGGVYRCRGGCHCKWEDGCYSEDFIANCGGRFELCVATRNLVFVESGLFASCDGINKIE